MEKTTLDLIRGFAVENKQLCSQRSKIACILGITLVPLFGFLDKAMIPSMFIFFMKARLVISFLIALILISLFTKTGKRYPEILGGMFFCIVGIMIAYMTRHLGGYKSTYYAGLNLLFLAMGILMPWRLRNSIITSFIIYGFYIIPICVFDKIDDVPILLNNNFFLLATLTIAFTSNYVAYRLRFQEFKSRYSLAEAKGNLQGAYEKLKDLDSLKTQFFSNISHEFRTPLTLILAPAESILKGEIGNLPAHGRHLVETIHSNTLRLLKLINNLLDLSRIDAGKMDLNYEKLNINEFIRGILAEILPLAKKKDLTLGFLEGKSIPQFYFDPDKMEKVFLNIIYNSIKFTDKGGKIALNTSVEDKDVIVTVKDTGIGIEKKDLNKIFDRFVQVDGSQKRRFEGTGIGLPLAKELVELHKGAINADSEIGKGTTISFTLPLILEYREKEEASLRKEDDWTKIKFKEAAYSGADIVQDTVKVTADTIEAGLNEAKKILVVEDNADMMNFIGLQLKNEYKILTANNGKEGLELALREIPDLIISDVMMPVMDGYELCNDIKKNETTKHIPVIFLTAKAGMDMKIEGYEKGADEYLVKPFNSEELRARVKSLLNLRRLGKEIQERNEELSETLKKLKETQSQLVHSEKMASLGQLVAGIAHEMNNPLAAALSSSNAIMKHIDRSKKGQEDLNNEVERKDIEETVQFLRHGLERASNIVNDLKIFSKKDVSGMKDTNIHEGLDSTLNILQGRLKEKNVSVHRNYSYPGLAECALGLINQVFMNVLQNSIDASDNNGKIWITTERDGDNVRILIKDNGMGIKKEVLPKIFDPFFTTKDIGKGIGLGLSISYSIIKEHSGIIEIQSEEDQGTEVSITLPIRQKEMAVR